VNPAEYPGQPAADLDTPALLVDLDALEHNIDRMARHFAATDKTLRPHTKSHKTPAIANRQLGAGACGVTCAKLGEAEVMADAGIDDILIANEIVGRHKLERLMRLAARCDIMVAADDPAALQRLQDAAAAAGVRPRLLLEVNIGHDRCGLPPGPALLGLAQQAVAASHLRFQGLMGYEGHVVDLEDRQERESGARQCLQRLVDARADLESGGIDVPICSASGTGDYYISTDFDGVTEVQAGSYALMDAAYARLDLGFRNALTVLTTVVSRPSAPQVVTDAGLKSVTPEHGMPLVKGRPDLECHALSEEHGRLRAQGEPGLEIGDLLEFVPGHGCTTVNLHDTLYAVRAGRLEEIWPIAARGKVR